MEQPPETADHGHEYDARPWSACYAPGMPAQVVVPAGGVSDLLARSARRCPDRVAIRFEQAHFTWRQLDRRATHIARALSSMGVEKGTRVALVLPNCPQAVMAFFGVLRLGAVVVWTNPLYTERELHHQLADAQAEVAICLDLAYGRLRAVRAQLTLRHVVVTSVLDELPLPIRTVGPWTRHGKEVTAAVPRGDDVVGWRAFVRRGHRGPESWSTAEPGQLAALQYTGGTTGTPKGVMLTHANLLANTEQAVSLLPESARAELIILAVVPLFHAYGVIVCLLAGARVGATVLLHPRFQLERVIDAVARYRPNLLPGVPTLYVPLTEAALRGHVDLRSIRWCLSAAAPLPPRVASEFQQQSGGRLVEAYGLTEASPATHANLLYGPIGPVGSIGVPLPSTDARIVDPHDHRRALPVGEVGELIVRGPQVMAGYWQQASETAAVLQDGWLATGDLARMDPQGWFFLVERSKDVIITAGFNVYPREVEDALSEHPAVQEVAVVGVSDPYRGEIVKAFVVRHPDADVDEGELRRFVRERLAPYKVPRAVEFRSELPKNQIGKVLRRLLAPSSPNSPDESAASH